MGFYQAGGSESGQTTDKNGESMSNFIGSMIKDGKIAPLDYESWHKVPNDVKEKLCSLDQDRGDHVRRNSPCRGDANHNQRKELVLPFEPHSITFDDIKYSEGYIVFECNHNCHCIRSCKNRILQNRVQVQLEVYKTEEKELGSVRNLNQGNF
ncbi:hypothetical protein OROMI_008466 [Orobanche minor]